MMTPSTAHLWFAPTRRWCGALLAVVMLMALSAARADAAWTPAVNASPSMPGTDDPVAAVGGNGYRIAAWLRGDGINQRVQLSSRSGSSWSALEYASPAGRDADDPQVAIDADGDAVLVWRRFDGTNWVVEARPRSAAGVYGSLQTLSSSGQDAFDPQVRIDGSGNSVLAWRRIDSSGISRIFARHRSAAGVLGPTATLSGAGEDAHSPRLAMTESGDAVVAWERSDGSNERVEAKVWRADATAGPLLRLSPAGVDADDPAVAAGPGAAAIFAWTQSDGANSRIRTRRMDDAAVLAPTRIASVAGRDALDPDLATTPVGDAVLTWRRRDGADWRVQVQGESVDGTASVVRTISNPGGEALDPRIAVNADGLALIVWRRFDGTRWVVQSLERDPDGALLGTLSHSGATDAVDPRVAMNTGGEALLAWRPDDAQSANGIAVRRRVANGHYPAVESLFGGHHSAREQQVAVAPDGSAVMVWRRSDGLTWRIEGRRRAPDGTLGPVVSLGPGELDEAHLRLAVDADGDALATWNAVSDTAYPGVMARAWNADGTLGPTQWVTPSGRRAEIAMTPGGETFIAWERWNGDRLEVAGRNRLADGTYGSVVLLSPVGGWGSSPQVARSQSGRTIIAWMGYVGTGNEPAQLRSRAADGTLSPIQTASSNEIVAEIDVAIGDDDAGYLIWRRNRDGGFAIRGRGIDATDQLGALQGFTPTTSNAIRPQVAAMADDRMVATWLVQPAESSNRWVQARIVETDGTLGTTRNISSTSVFVDSSPRVAVSGADEPVFIWSRYVAPFIQQVEARKLSSAGVLGPITGLSNPARDAGAPQIAGGDAGVVAVWAARDELTVPRVQVSAGP